jgi:general secretion pathway protein A
MYAEHFGLRTEAFALTPDPAFLYRSPDHAEALAALKIGLEGRRGLMLMIGEVGMGKTTLLYSLLSELGAEIHTAYISNTRLSFDEILRQALADFGVPCASRDRIDLLNALNGFLHQCAAAGETAALIVDEAQNLDEEAFENLRLLSNYETYTEKLLQIVLVGQPELDVKLSRPSLRQVTERVAVRCHINPLGQEEAVRYLEHRLHCVGGSTAIFTPAALRLAVKAAKGIPRRLNIICHNALLFAFGHGLTTVSFAEVNAAVQEKRGRGLISFNAGRFGLGGGNGAMSALGKVWKIAAAAAASAFAIGWAIGYIGARPVPEHSAPSEPRAQVESMVDSAPFDAAVAAFAAMTRDDDAQARSAPVLASSPTALNSDVIANTLANGSTSGSEGAPPADAGAPDQVAPPADAQAHGRQIVVPRGRSLLGLARQYYGDGALAMVPRIQAMNPQIVDVDRIMAGDMLRLPEIENAGSRVAAGVAR